jgi:hypothetical protein
MLERNFLSHLKLGLLLALLSFSILLHTNLVEEEPDDDSTLKSRTIIAAVQIVAALAAIGAGYWEYASGCKDLIAMRAFLVNEKSVVLGLCNPSLSQSR